MTPSDRVPKLPLFSRASFQPAGPPVPCVLEAGEVKYFMLGRMALAAALKDAHIGTGDQVLLPAYHCIVMVDAVISVGAKPVFYRIEPDTAVNLQDLEKRITPSVKALLVAHYFGFPQPGMRAVRALCDARNLVLVEDCAHALLGRDEQKMFEFGILGDYIIASPWKFLPTVDGGCLISNRRSLARVAPKSPGIRYQLKILVNLCEFAFDHGRLRKLRPLRTLFLLKDRWRQIIEPVGNAPEMERHTNATDLSIDFDPAWIGTEASWCAKLIIKRAAWSGIGYLRRKNYERLDSALRNLPGCAPLFARLPDGIVPQVYPMLVDEPEKVFPQLKALGVPIIRFGEFLWEHMDRNFCPASQDLSRRVFQFPCHQDLRPDELEWIARNVREVVERVRSGERADGTENNQRLENSTDRRV